MSAFPYDPCYNTILHLLSTLDLYSICTFFLLGAVTLLSKSNEHVLAYCLYTGLLALISKTSFLFLSLSSNTSSGTMLRAYKPVLSRPAEDCCLFILRDLLCFGSGLSSLSGCESIIQLVAEVAEPGRYGLGLSLLLFIFSTLSLHSSLSILRRLCFQLAYFSDFEYPGVFRAVYIG